MENTSIPHFSKKILFISTLFVLVNLIFYVLFFWDWSPEYYRTVAPKLSLSSAGDVQVKTLYEDKYHRARSGDELGEGLIVGSTIKTGEGGFAELVLENNVIRLKDNTEVTLIENTFTDYDSYSSTLPRLIFSLKHGTLWVNAFDKVEVRSGSSDVQFFHSIGSVVYTPPLNRAMVFTGVADLALYDQNRKPLANFAIPLHNQVTYVDSQLVPEYALIKPSKLKKELKLSAVPDALLDDEWVLRNAYRDAQMLRFRSNLIHFASFYVVQDKYYTLRSLFTFLPHAKRESDIEHAELKLRYLLGGIEQSGKVGKAKTLIEEINSLLAERKKDPEVKRMLTEIFFSINTSDIESSAGLLEEYLLDYIFTQDGPMVLRSRLSDLRENLRRGDTETAHKITEKWAEKWNDNMVSKNQEEFLKQYQIFHNLMVSYAPVITSELLAAFDAAGQIRLKVGEDAEEVRYSVTEDLLAIGTGLINAYRYLDAKQYLKNSYQSLKIDDLDPNLASTVIFLEFGKLLAQRIEYAEQELRGAALPIDETEFREYIRRKTRDQLLSNDLRAFLEIDKKTVLARQEEELVQLPTVKEVIGQFTEAGVNVLDRDVTKAVGLEFDFEVKNARLFDRAMDGSLIVFEALYNPISDSLTQVKLGQTTLKGAFHLKDLVNILKARGQNLTTPILSEEDHEKALQELTEILQHEEGERATADQFIAEDLAKQVAWSELNHAGIKVVTVDRITVLDTFDLDQFEVNPALVTNPSSADPIKVKFKYNSATKIITDIMNPETDRLISPSATFSNFNSIVVTDFYRIQTLESAVDQFKKIMKNKAIVFKDSDLMVDTAGQIAVKSFKLETLPFTVSGVFDLQVNRFVTAESEIYVAQDVGLEDYFMELAKRYALGFLEENGLLADPDQITLEMIYPFKEIKVKEYPHGDYKFNFTLDFANDRLRKLTLLGSGVEIEVMSFEEFKNIARAASSDSPKLPSQN